MPAYTTDNFNKLSASINTVQPPFGATFRINDRPPPISNHWHKTPKTFSVKALLELEPFETTTSLLGDRDRFWGWRCCKFQSLTCLTHGLISMSHGDPKGTRVGTPYPSQTTAFGQITFSPVFAHWANSNSAPLTHVSNQVEVHSEHYLVSYSDTHCLYTMFLIQTCNEWNKRIFFYQKPIWARVSP